MSDVKYQAQQISNKISASGEIVGIDPTTITLILTSVLPMLFDCLKTNDDVSSSTVQNRVKTMYEKNPSKLIRRTTLAVLKEHKRSEKKKPKNERIELSKEDAEVMARAIIEQTINESNTDVSSACYDAELTIAEEE